MHLSGIYTLYLSYCSPPSPPSPRDLWEQPGSYYVWLTVIVCKLTLFGIYASQLGYYSVSQDLFMIHQFYARLLKIVIVRYAPSSYYLYLILELLNAHFQPPSIDNGQYRQNSSKVVRQVFNIFAHSRVTATIRRIHFRYRLQRMYVHCRQLTKWLLLC